jgi:hypothetical protein
MVQRAHIRIKNLLWLVFAGTLFIALTVGCGAQKEANERRNFMIPKKSEMPKNSRYKEVDKRKTNKIHTSKSKRKSLF